MSTALNTREFKKQALSLLTDDRCIELAAAWLVAKSFAETVQEQVTAYTAPIFAQYTFFDINGNQITEQKRLYRCQDEPTVHAYWTACDAAHRSGPFAKMMEGKDWSTCPALMAENDALSAETAFIEHICERLGFEHIWNRDLRNELRDTVIAGIMGGPKGRLLRRK